MVHLVHVTGEPGSPSDSGMEFGPAGMVPGHFFYVFSANRLSFGALAKADQPESFWPCLLDRPSEPRAQPDSAIRVPISVQTVFIELLHGAVRF